MKSVRILFVIIASTLLLGSCLSDEAFSAKAGTDGAAARAGGIDGISRPSPQAGEEGSAAEPKPPARGKIFNFQLKWALIAISMSVAAGICVRNRRARKLRPFFLLASIVLLGFYNGACPCPIQSLMNIVRIFTGKKVLWQSLVYFVGLIPVTYIFGRVWCGWVCHMGALQEFLYLPGRFRLTIGDRTRAAMRTAQYILLAALVVWVAVTKVAVWCRYDPFRVAYNLYSSNTVGWILLAVLVLLSLFVHRPFCRIACPIGLVLGWLARLPGASVIGLKKQCAGCLSCKKVCEIDAITGEGCSMTLENAECNSCGDCIDACKISGLEFARKGKSHPARLKCGKES